MRVERLLLLAAGGQPRQGVGANRLEHREAGPGVRSGQALQEALVDKRAHHVPSPLGRDRVGRVEAEVGYEDTEPPEQTLLPLFQQSVARVDRVPERSVMRQGVARAARQEGQPSITTAPSSSTCRCAAYVGRSWCSTATSSSRNATPAPTRDATPGG